MNEGKLKKVLLGYDDFRAFIEAGGYYVDKSLFLKEIIDRLHQVTLITRPRRFGKSLNLSMLRYFWELPACRVNETNLDRDMSHLFRDLAIWEEGESYRALQGKFPIIFFSFRGAKQNDWSDTAWSIKSEIAREYDRHSYLLEDDGLKGKAREKFVRILNQEGELIDYTERIVILTKCLSLHFKQNPIILIDEYDTTIQKGYLVGYYEEAINFFKGFLVKGLKGNGFLQHAVLTGIMKVAQESIFSDFNNPMVSTITSQSYSDKFGFTEPEVKKMLEYFGYGYTFPRVKEWYNGYIFGKAHNIYNPWSILKFIQEGADLFRPYWLNTSDNQLLKDVLQLDKTKSKEVLKRLLKGEEVTEALSGNVVYKDIQKTPEAAWNFLLHSGYLKAYDPTLRDDTVYYKLEIPNKEIRTVYVKMSKLWFEENQPINRDIGAIIKSLKKEDWPLFEEHLSRILLKTVSFYDLNEGTKKLLPEEKEEVKQENFYHGLMLGLMVHLTGEYQVESNREYDEGRPDMVILPLDKKGTAFIFEFKALKQTAKQEAGEAAERALAQIVEKKYAEGVRAAGYKRVLTIGIGFKGKGVKTTYGFDG